MAVDRSWRKTGATAGVSVPSWGPSVVGSSSQPHKTKPVLSRDLIYDQSLQSRFQIKLPYSPPCCHWSLPSHIQHLWKEHTRGKHSVPGSRTRSSLGLMTSKSPCQELFKAGNRSPRALNRNKYSVDWFLPCFSKGNVLPGLSSQ